MRGSLLGLACSTALGLALVAAAVAYGGEPVSTQPGPAGAPPGGDLGLSIRARALGLVPDPSIGPSSSLGLEVQKAPTGAGVTRMPPARVELGSGVYLEVTPSCLPGDDFGAPFFPRGRSPRR